MIKGSTKCLTSPTIYVIDDERENVPRTFCEPQGPSRSFVASRVTRIWDEPGESREMAQRPDCLINSLKQHFNDSTWNNDKQRSWHHRSSKSRSDATANYSMDCPEPMPESLECSHWIQEMLVKIFQEKDVTERGLGWCPSHWAQTGFPGG